MPIVPYKGIKPRIAADVFIAPNSFVIGDVEIGSGSSVWYNCVIRADVNFVKIGAKTNIQDGTVVHVASKNPGSTIIGSNVTIGHAALLHACEIADNSFIGMRSTIMDDVYVNQYGWVGAGALITIGKKINMGELWTGVPGKFSRNISAREKEEIKNSSQKYCNLASQYKAMDINF